MQLRVVERVGTDIVSETVEEHTMRYFVPERFAETLGEAGFGGARFLLVPALDRTPGPADWNVAGVAVAV